jgi:hypothetical protein
MPLAPLEAPPRMGGAAVFFSSSICRRRSSSSPGISQHLSCTHTWQATQEQAVGVLRNAWQARSTAKIKVLWKHQLSLLASSL